MPDTELLTWVKNFTQLQAELDNYEATLADITTIDGAAASRAGGGQLVAFQLAQMLPMFAPIMQAHPNPTDGDLETAPGHVLLASRYFLEMTAVAGEDLALNDARTTLKSLAARLHDMAVRWSASGVDPEERAVIAKEAQVTAERVKKLAEAKAK
ncbi:hypothetical protein O4215_20575 [Rhodococcus maanshanensis]|uniref:hypothetical protein n=1 Tax=Rhodococcus maanshanensis TaxID=183556 RepID=UPI0022B43758|nr:hypothetical protein [Rhodococcus maanshanensis]MCZ4557960.1 hypothetical protein [Rhodococcus maanshanensis]